MQNISLVILSCVYLSLILKIFLAAQLDGNCWRDWWYVFGWCWGLLFCQVLTNASNKKCFTSLVAYHLRKWCWNRIFLFVFIDSWYFDTVCSVDVYRHCNWILAALLNDLGFCNDPQQQFKSFASNWDWLHKSNMAVFLR